MREFIGTCVGNPFASVGDLCQVVENARPITKRTFLRRCNIPSDLKAEFTMYPHSFEFSKYNGIIGEDIYFYTWSAIEHFYN